MVRQKARAGIGRVHSICSPPVIPRPRPVRCQAARGPGWQSRQGRKGGVPGGKQPTVTAVLDKGSAGRELCFYFQTTHAHLLFKTPLGFHFLKLIQLTHLLACTTVSIWYHAFKKCFKEFGSTRSSSKLDRKKSINTHLKGNSPRALYCYLKG